MVSHRTAATIVMVTSVNARLAHRGFAAYAASKDGVETLTKVAALEFA
jgi:NAD(P)-dependent dehydrogenase (short-subunit alcohol dehydrogenase family)